MSIVEFKHLWEWLPATIVRSAFEPYHALPSNKIWALEARFKYYITKRIITVCHKVLCGLLSTSIY